MLPRLLMAICLFAVSLEAAPRIKLYLTNGTDQIVREYEVLADRVRYYSIERSAWEEVPLTLVDLERTRAEERADQEEQRTRAREDRVEAEAERQARTELHNVPIDDGVYHLAGEEIVPVPQSEVMISGSKKNTFLQVVAPIPIVAGKSTVEVEGPTSGFAVRSARPMFYLRLSKISRFGMVRADVKKEKRVVQVLKKIPRTTEIFEEQEEIEVFRQQLAPQVYKVWPIEPLAPGEYALVEFTPGEADIRVWDFRLSSGPEAAKGR
jgi:hypothetical protein